jgi:hypothetical protein
MCKSKDCLLAGTNSLGYRRKAHTRGRMESVSKLAEIRRTTTRLKRATTHDSPRKQIHAGQTCNLSCFQALFRQYFSNEIS